MMRKLAVCGAAFFLLAGQALAWDPEMNEEDAGSSFSLQLNPVEGIYGVAYEQGSWVVNTPIFGQYFITTYYSGLEESLYGGIGMMLRLMPHWALAPFAGVGGSYNYAGWTMDAPNFFGGHAEGGLRLWFGGRAHFLEGFVRQTYSSINRNHDFWMAGIGYGQDL